MGYPLMQSVPHASAGILTRLPSELRAAGTHVAPGRVFGIAPLPRALDRPLARTGMARTQVAHPPEKPLFALVSFRGPPKVPADPWTNDVAMETSPTSSFGLIA